MLATPENIADASPRRPAIGNLRLQLKPAHRSCGFVQGAWWPRSNELTSELPSLLAALSLRVGSIDSVLYHESDWSPAPLSLKHQAGQVILAANQEWPSVDQLLGIGTRRAGDPLPSPVALQRWESDGGATPAPRSQARMQDA